MNEITIFATPQIGGKWTLTDGKGKEMQSGQKYDTRERPCKPPRNYGLMVIGSATVGGSRHTKPYPRSPLDGLQGTLLYKVINMIQTLLTPRLNLCYT